jgi:hypothetical protein
MAKKEPRYPCPRMKTEDRQRTGAFRIMADNELGDTKKYLRLMEHAREALAFSAPRDLFGAMEENFNFGLIFERNVELQSAVYYARQLQRDHHNTLDPYLYVTLDESKTSPFQYAERTKALSPELGDIFVHSLEARVEMMRDKNARPFQYMARGLGARELRA